MNGDGRSGLCAASKSEDVRRTVVIGAGPAGLTAAYRLTELGYPVEVFEAAPYVGGLARSITLWGHRVDLGSHVYSPGHTEIDRIWNEAVGERYHLLELRRGLLDAGRIHPYPFDPLKLVRSLGSVEALRCVLSWALRTRGRRIDSTEDWVTSRYGRRLYETLLRSYVEKLWGVASREIEPTFAMTLLGENSASVEVTRRLMSRLLRSRRSSVPRFPYPLEGTGAIWDGMVKLIQRRGGVFHLLAPVERVLVNEGSVRGVHVHGQLVVTSNVISTLPLRRLVTALSNGTNLGPENVPRARSTVLVYLDVENGDALTELWLYILDRAVAAGRVTNLSAWRQGARPGDPASVLCIEYWCDVGDGLWCSPDEALLLRAEREMRAVGLIKRAVVRRGHVERLANTHTGHQRGSAAAIEQMRAIVEQIGGLWSVGRHGLSNLSSMTGAMASGYAAADAVANSTVSASNSEMLSLWPLADKSKRQFHPAINPLNTNGRGAQ
jgi:protoporphyrinogen oxidase